jgi:thiol:disulfide interchange protein DsbA|tara:strand:- start:289 stop:963 length:675 start_codon:yes stop_codon:yes gene_type:complete
MQINNMIQMQTKTITGAIQVFLLLLSALIAPAVIAGEAYVEGVHYEAISVPVSTGLTDKVEVVEVFGYLCIHCYSFDPMLGRWEKTKPAGVDFKRVPAVFSTDWSLLAQAFYTAETLGVGAKMHEPLFEAIHIDRLNLSDEQVLAELFLEHAGVDTADFTQAFSSFSVKSRVSQANAKGRAYGITGVPTMVVNGKYRVDGRMAGSNEDMLKVVDFLVAKEQAAL